MGTWNYRVIQQRKSFTSETKWFAVHEAHYSEDSVEKPHSITERAISPGGETVDELRAELQRMLLALDKPVLEYGDF